MLTWLEKGRDGKLWDELMLLIDKRLAPAIARAFKEAVRLIQDGFTLKELAELLTAGQTVAAEQLVVRAGSMSGLKAATQRVLLEAAKDELARASRLFNIGLHLDHFSPTVVSFAEQHVGRLVTNIVADQRAVINDIIVDALKTGKHPYETAREIRLFIGLTPDQRRAVVNYRDALQRQDMNALARALRDRRSDPKILRLFQEGKPLTPLDINRLVEAYAERWLNHRAVTIARTESLQALNMGHRLAWVQAAADGKFDAATLYRRWFTSPDERLCPVCQPIPGMNPDGVALWEAFQTPNGPVMDAPLHPNCRCVIFTRPR